MGKKISVIIPVYDVEEYLHRCVDSVINQTYKDLEIILVDDESPDKCPEICDKYAKQDGRIKVIHKKNGGQSSARNIALDSQLEGDYVGFVDSDDWLDLDFYEHCMQLIEEYDADVVQMGYIAFGNKSKARNKIEFEKIEIYEGKEILQYYMEDSTATGSYGVWRNLFKKECIGNLRFREGKINEDIDWKYLVLSNCHRMVNSNLQKYNYLMSNVSASKGGLKHRDFDLYEAGNLLQQITAAETYGTIAFLGKVKQARTAFSLLSKIAYYGVADKSLDEKTLICRLTKEHQQNMKILLSAPIPKSRKILVVLFSINFRLAKVVVRAGKKIVNYI